MPRKRLHPNSEGPGLQPPKTAFGKRLHKFLVDHGVRTVAEGAQLLGFSRQSILNWRRGDSTPSKTTRRLLEAYFSGDMRPPGSAKS